MSYGGKISSMQNICQLVDTNKTQKWSYKSSENSNNLAGHIRQCSNLRPNEIEWKIESFGLSLLFTLTQVESICFWHNSNLIEQRAICLEFHTDKIIS